jgi:translation elongation factor EF-1alpha
MIGGAAQADVAILVISAKKGEFESGYDKGGQTREHVRLVKTIGLFFLNSRFMNPTDRIYRVNLF